MTRKVMLSKFGDATDDIIFRKTNDPDLREKEVRAHPECPLRKDSVKKTWHVVLSRAMHVRLCAGLKPLQYECKSMKYDAVLHMVFCCVVSITARRILLSTCAWTKRL